MVFDLVVHSFHVDAQITFGGILIPTDGTSDFLDLVVDGHDVPGQNVFVPGLIWALQALGTLHLVMHVGYVFLEITTRRSFVFTFGTHERFVLVVDAGDVNFQSMPSDRFEWT